MMMELFKTTLRHAGSKSLYTSCLPILCMAKNMRVQVGANINMISHASFSLKVITGEIRTALIGTWPQSWN